MLCVGGARGVGEGVGVSQGRGGVGGWAITAKARRPLPDKRRGLGDPRARVRRPYRDHVVNPTARRRLAARSATVRSLRDTLHGRGYLEVDTPLLQPVHGGASARGEFHLQAAHSVSRGMDVDGFQGGGKIPGPADVGDLIQGNFSGKCLFFNVDRLAGEPQVDPGRVTVNGIGNSAQGVRLASTNATVVPLFHSLSQTQATRTSMKVG